MIEEKDQFLGENESYWREKGIIYDDFTCAIGWFPEGWDYENKDFVMIKTPDADVISWMRADTEKNFAYIPSDWKEYRVGALRGQVFVCADMDDTQGYAVAQKIE